MEEQEIDLNSDHWRTDWNVFIRMISKAFDDGLSEKKICDLIERNKVRWVGKVLDLALEYDKYLGPSAHIRMDRVDIQLKDGRSARSNFLALMLSKNAKELSRWKNVNRGAIISFEAEIEGASSIQGALKCHFIAADINDDDFGTLSPNLKEATLVDIVKQGDGTTGEKGYDEDDEPLVFLLDDEDEIDSEQVIPLVISSAHMKQEISTINPFNGELQSLVVGGEINDRSYKAVLQFFRSNNNDANKRFVFTTNDGGRSIIGPGPTRKNTLLLDVSNITKELSEELFELCSRHNLVIELGNESVGLIVTNETAQDLFGKISTLVTSPGKILEVLNETEFL